MPIVKSWDWIPEFSIRNTFYPFYLSLPLHLLRWTGLDSNFLVVNSVYFMNTLIQVACDYFTHKLAKRLIGPRGAKVALVFSLFNYETNLILQKTLTNNPETAFTVAGLYFFSKLKPSIDENM